VLQEMHYHDKNLLVMYLKILKGHFLRTQ